MDSRHRTNGQPATAPLRRRPLVWAHRWRGHLLELAERLDGDGEVGVRGVASTSVLLTDGRSPLWWRSEVEELHDAVEAALIGLGCPAWAT
jgi:hypothetical protein